MGLPTVFPSEPFYIRNSRFFPIFSVEIGVSAGNLGILGQLNRREKSGQPTGIDIHSRVQSAKKYRL